MKYLGIDYGQKKVGLSLSEGQIASSYKVITIHSLQEALSKVLQVIKQESVDQVVIGKPESGLSLKITQNFIAELKKYIPVIEADETLSSFQAKNLMLELNKPKKLRQQDDSVAAAIILQNYLDKIKDEE